VSQADVAAAAAAAVFAFLLCSPGDVLSDPNNNAGAVTISTLTYDSGTKLLTGTGYIVSVTGTLTLTGAGAAKMERCPNNAWTKALGATNVDECRE
jgi:hypothetical protein